MKEYTVQTVTKPVDIQVEVPGSKSITNRALMIAALGSGRTVLEGVLFSDDSRYFISSLQSLGFQVEVEEEKKRVIIQGEGGRIPNQETEIYVGSAGTAARFLTAMLALSDGTYIIRASEQMEKRPMLPLFQALESMGACFTYLKEEGHLPVQVQGTAQPAAEVSVDIHKSTQFLSALLMMAPILQQDMKIRITSEKKTGAYIKITTHMMKQFGVLTEFDGETYTIAKGQRYQCVSYQIEPDVSAACYFWAMATLTGGRALVKNIHMSSMQGDRRFLDVLKQLDASIEDTDAGICVIGPKDGIYEGITVDMNNFSDQTMTLAALAVYAKSPTRIENIGHIRLQESDRLHAIATELGKMGLDVEEGEDYLVITPKKPQPSDVETYEDHRMAMAFALIGLKSEGIRILNPLCCRKTFENYFSIFDKIIAQS